MDDTSEIRLRNELQYIIPRDVYNSIIEELNQVSKEFSTKSSQDYYIM